uniref:Uncharacterized protein n=1 Tax=Timema shepardi TaxID=629360 RepID=A0A7R9B974_TIMSH|nr:unnamed protein product [Timema shepardi]
MIVQGAKGTTKTQLQQSRKYTSSACYAFLLSRNTLTVGGPPVCEVARRGRWELIK